MSVRAERLDRPNAAFGVGVDPLPRHLTITQAVFLADELRRAIREARKANDEVRVVA